MNTGYVVLPTFSFDSFNCREKGHILSFLNNDYKSWVCCIDFVHGDLEHVDVVLGDLDSALFVPPDSRDTYFRAPRLLIPEQDTTDSEKAIIFLSKQGIEKIIFIGDIGHISSHYLYNLTLAHKYKNIVQVEFLSPTERIFFISSNGQVEGKIGSKISFFGLGSAVTVDSCYGLLYPVEGMVFSLCGNSSISNVLTHSSVEMKLSGDGTLVCVLEI